ADVRRRLLAADVLLAGLQGEREAALALGVDGLAHDAPGHAADELLLGGDEARPGAAEVHLDAERLAFADRDVAPALAGRLQDGGGGRVHARDRQRARRVGDLGDGGQVLQAAEEVRVLHDDAGRVLGRLAEGGDRGRAADLRDLDDR